MQSLRQVLFGVIAVALVILFALMFQSTSNQKLALGAVCLVLIVAAALVNRLVAPREPS